MKYSLCLGVVYLLFAISSVHSASYLYRFGREVVVPSVNDEVQEIVSELKKDEPVVLVEEMAVVPNNPVVSENVDQAVAVKNVPASVVSTVENVPAVENNLIAAPEQPAVASQVVNEEARAKPNPAIRFNELEVIQPGGGKSEKVQTVADTVKNAAVQAIEKQNEEVEKAKPIEPVNEVVVPAVKAVPEDVEEPDKIVDEIKEPEEPVVPAVVPNVKVEKLVETVRSAEPEPVKQVEVQDQKVHVEKSDPVSEKAEPVPPSPERQDSNPNQQQNPIQQLTMSFQNTLLGIQNTLSGIIANSPFAGIRPQADATAGGGGGAPAGALNTNEISTNAVNPPTQAASSPTTGAPNLLANVISNFNNFATNILPRPTAAPIEAASPQQTQAQTGTRGDQATQVTTQSTVTPQTPNIIDNIQNALNKIATNIFQRTTAAPIAAPIASSPESTVVKGTREDEEEVEVVQNIDIVNDKVDLTKKGQ